MSYDYNSLLTNIYTERALAYDNTNTKNKNNNNTTNLDEKVEVTNATALQKTIEKFTELASFCPLPPALTLLYASDTFNYIVHLLDDTNLDQALECKSDVLESGVREFPGCAKLWLTLIHTKLTLLIVKYYQMIYLKMI